MYIACSEGETTETMNEAPSKDEQRYVLKFLTLQHLQLKYTADCVVYVVRVYL